MFGCKFSIKNNFNDANTIIEIHLDVEKGERFE